MLYGEHVDEEVVKIYEEEMQARAADDLGVGVLGSGSDYTVFLQRIGVCVENIYWSVSRIAYIYCRLQARTTAFSRRSRTLSTTTIPFTTHSGGRSCMPTRDSCDM